MVETYRRLKKKIPHLDFWPDFPPAFWPHFWLGFLTRDEKYSFAKHKFYRTEKHSFAGSTGWKNTVLHCRLYRRFSYLFSSCFSYYYSFLRNWFSFVYRMVRILEIGNRDSHQLFGQIFQQLSNQIVDQKYNDRFYQDGEARPSSMIRNQIVFSPESGFS